MDGIVRWSDALSLGMPDIDGQHKGLLDVIDELWVAVLSKFESQHIARILNELDHHSRTHFSAEEALMRVDGYPNFDDHREDHATFTNHLSMARAKLSAGEFPAVDLLRHLNESMVRHIESHDRDYARFIAERQQAKPLFARLWGDVLPRLADGPESD